MERRDVQYLPGDVEQLEELLAARPYLIVRRMLEIKRAHLVQRISEQDLSVEETSKIRGIIRGIDIALTAPAEAAAEARQRLSTEEA